MRRPDSKLVASSFSLTETDVSLIVVSLTKLLLLRSEAFPFLKLMIAGERGVNPNEDDAVGVSMLWIAFQRKKVEANARPNRKDVIMYRVVRIPANKTRFVVGCVMVVAFVRLFGSVTVGVSRWRSI